MWYIRNFARIFGVFARGDILDAPFFHGQFVNRSYLEKALFFPYTFISLP